MLEYSLIYIGFISVISVIVCVYDKLKAIYGGRRISEKSLMILSVIGGSVAMYMTMRIIRHKTLHNKFMIGIPIIIIFQFIVLLCVTKFIIK